MLDARSQYVLDTRVQRGVKLVNEVWGLTLTRDDEDFETAAKDAISDILTAAFGPAGHMLLCSDGDGYTKVTNADAYAAASALADSAVESYFGDAEDYVEAERVPEPGQYGSVFVGHERRTNLTERHVRPNPDGGWNVTDPAGRQINSHHGTDAQARLWARQIVRHAGGGTVKVYDRTGSKLVAEDQV